MMAKIVKGSGAKGIVDYILDSKKQATLIDCQGVLFNDNSSIARSFIAQSQLNPRVDKFIGHISLSFSKQDLPSLTDELMIQISREYMEKMGIRDTQYIIGRHYDKEHPHVHIVFNRIDNNGKTISDKNDMYRNEQVCKKLKTKHGLYFAVGKEQVKQHRLREPDKTKYEIYTAVKNEIGKSKNWQQLQRQLTEKNIGIQFKYKGQTDEIQGISFSKDEYTFKGSEIDRNFSYSKLDRYFGDAGLTTAGSNKQSSGKSIREPAPIPDKADNSFVTGLGGLFSASSFPVDEIPVNPDLRKKKKKKRQFKL